MPPREKIGVTCLTAFPRPPRRDLHRRICLPRCRATLNGRLISIRGFPKKIKPTEPKFKTVIQIV